MRWKKQAMLLGGNLIFAFGIAGFVIPAGILSGGGTGIALFLSRLSGISVSLLVGAVNLSALAAAFFLIGKAFFLTTVFSSCLYPLCLSLLQQLLPRQGLTQDILLNTCFGGALVGIGIGMILRSDASSGGTEIPAIILSRRTGVPLAVLLYSFDFFILLAQAFYSRLDAVLYSLLMVMITSFAVNQLTVGGQRRMQVTIISACLEEVNAYINGYVDRGSTFIHIRTGFKQEERLALSSVMERREVPQLLSWLEKKDPQAFVTIAPVNEVRGDGFSMRLRR